MAVTVELKSVNNRFRDINMRCPREYAALEPRIVALVKDRFSRVALKYTFAVSRRGGSTELQVNAAAAEEALLKLLGSGAATRGSGEDISLSFLAGLPGVLVQGEREADPTSEWSLVETAVEGAIEHMAAMREKEGDAMAADLRTHVSEMDALRSRIAGYSDGIASRLELWLMERLNRLVGDQVDECAWHKRPRFRRTKPTCVRIGMALVAH